jgi:hypothetical protein
MVASDPIVFHPDMRGSRENSLGPKMRRILPLLAKDVLANGLAPTPREKSIYLLTQQEGKRLYCATQDFRMTPLALVNYPSTRLWTNRQEGRRMKPTDPVQ